MIGALVSLLLLAQQGGEPIEVVTSDESPGWHGDWSARGEAVRDIPDPTQRPFERARLRLTYGYERGWLGARLLAAAGTDHNRDVLRRFDNVRADEVVLDRVYAHWGPGRLWLTAGKFGMPLTTTGLLWDPKLQAQGVAARRTFGGPRAEVHARALVSVRAHLHPDRSRLAAGQLDVQFANLAVPRLALGLFAFDHLEDTPRRTNRPASQFRVVSLLARKEVGIAERSFDAALHLVHNLDADVAASGGELTLRFHRLQRSVPWSLRYTGQRVQRDAVPAAFSDDVWWFHTAHRGHLLAASMTVQGITVELGGMVQRRDDLTERLSRAFLEVRGSF